MSGEANYLFEARDAEGGAVSEYVAATSAEDARKRLEARGLRDIRLLDDELSADMRARAERAGIASDVAVDLVSRFNPSPIALVGVAIRRNWFVHAVGIAIAAILASWSLAWGAVALAAVIGVALFPGYIQWLQNEVHKAFWRGDFARSEEVARKLRGMGFHKALPTILLELDSRIAYARVMQGDLPGALATLEPWGSPEKAAVVGPSMYPVKLAHLYFLAKEWDRYLAINEEILAASGNAPYARIDVAQLTARLGRDTAHASALLEGLDEERMPAMHVAFVKWGKGVLHLRAGRNEEALRDLTQCVDELQRHAANPLLWGSLAAATGYLCIAMARTGRRDGALAMVQGVRDIVLRHGEPLLVEGLAAEGLVQRA